MRQFKAPIAGNSTAIAKIGNAELAHFNKQMLIHELIRGSLAAMTGFGWLRRRVVFGGRSLLDNVT